MRFRHKKSADSPRLEMSSMIDVVFLLLIFFVMTFQIAAVEGDFAIAAPRSGPPADVETEPLEVVLQVHLLSAEDGSLAGVTLGDHRFADVDALQAFVRQYVQEMDDDGGRRENLKVDLRCDAKLKYQHTMDAITALRGYVSDDGRGMTLIESVRLKGSGFRDQDTEAAKPRHSLNPEPALPTPRMKLRHAPSSAATDRRAYRSASWRCWRGRAFPGPAAGRPRRPAGA